MSYEDIKAQAMREIKTETALANIEKKLDAIGEFIVAQNDDDDKNDGKALAFLTSIFGKAFGAKATTAAAVTATKAASSGVNGFSSL